MKTLTTLFLITLITSCGSKGQNAQTSATDTLTAKKGEDLDLETCKPELISEYKNIKEACNSNRSSSNDVILECEERYNIAIASMESEFNCKTDLNQTEQIKYVNILSQETMKKERQNYLDDARNNYLEGRSCGDSVSFELKKIIQQCPVLTNVRDVNISTAYKTKDQAYSCLNQSNNILKKHPNIDCRIYIPVGYSTKTLRVTEKLINHEKLLATQYLSL